MELFSADSRIYACFEDSTKKSKNRLKATWQLGRAIKSKLEHEGGIDIAITLTNHFYSALLLYACGARVRIGYKRGVGNMFLTHKLARVGGLHQVENYAHLLDLLPQVESKTLDSSPKAAIPPLRLCAAPKQALDSKPLRIGLNPGAAYGSAKCWDKEHYARVGAHFAALGAEVVVYGVGADRELAEEIIKKIDFILGDSALGSHSADLANFEATADHKSSSAPKQAKRCERSEAGFFRKFAKNYESNTAIPRIFEEESRASLRDTAPAVARQSTHNAQKSKKVDSSMDCHATATALARNDSNNAQSSNT
ncbi:glycosyltransferase family 9 protein, partial [Helicobacter canis]|uniref:glycosyltransferase family 9 protein n=1 Tax=Helicobacter canis TaxID=29419 RepID=UPI0026EF5B26